MLILQSRCFHRDAYPIRFPISRMYTEMSSHESAKEKTMQPFKTIHEAYEAELSSAVNDVVFRCIGEGGYGKEFTDEN